MFALLKNMLLKYTRVKTGDKEVHNKKEFIRCRIVNIVSLLAIPAFLNTAVKGV